MKRNEHISRLPQSQLSENTYRQFIRSLFNIDTEKANLRLRYLQWLLAENPLLSSTEDLPIYIYWIDSTPVGQLSAIPVDLVLEGEPVKGGWAIDFYILKQYQRQGIGKKLLDAVHEDFPLLLGIGNSDASFGLFKKIGWRHTTAMTHYFKILNPERTIWKMILHLLGRIKRKLGFNYIESKQAFSKPVSKTFHAPEGLQLESVNSFENEKLQSEIRSITNKDTYIKRSRAFLQWRYFSSPFVQYNVHRIRSNQSEIYVIWRVFQNQSLHCAMIVDVLSTSDVSTKDLRAMLDLMIDYASAQGVERFECITNNARALEAFPNGILTRRSPGSWFQYGTRDSEQCPNIKSCEVFAGDCDIDAAGTYKGK